MDGTKNRLLLPCLSAYHLLTMQSWCRNRISSPNPINSSIGFFIQRGFKWFKYLFKPILSCKWTILVQYLHVPLYLGVLASFFLWIPLDWPCLNAMTFSSKLMKFHIVHEGSLGTLNKMKCLDDLFKFLRVQWLNVSGMENWVWLTNTRKRSTEFSGISLKASDEMLLKDPKPFRWLWKLA